MSKWYKIELEWTNRLHERLIVEDTVPLHPADIHITLKPEIYKELNFQKRIKAKLRRYILPEAMRIILKFKNEQDAMAMKLWL